MVTTVADPVSIPKDWYSDEWWSGGGGVVVTMLETGKMFLMKWGGGGRGHPLDPPLN